MGILLDEFEPYLQGLGDTHRSAETPIYSMYCTGLALRYIVIYLYKWLSLMTDDYHTMAWVGNCSISIFVIWG
jgi:hypothetical protein